MPIFEKPARKESNRGGTGVRSHVFLSHALDNTGAPLVLARVVEEFASKYGGSSVRLLSPSINAEMAHRLDDIGIAREATLPTKRLRTVGRQLGLTKNSFLLMNTVSVPEAYQRYVFHALDGGQLVHAFWFIHEDRAQLRPDEPVVSARAEIAKLMRAGRLTVLVPSAKTKKEYDQLLQPGTVDLLPYSISVPPRYRTTKSATDYDRLEFLLVGSAANGRKGQMIALAAFQEFMTTYYRINPMAYREFRLTLVDIGEDYMSEQVRAIGDATLGTRLKIYPSLSHEETLEVTSRCNVVVCCSASETFGLYVAEGMAMGHLLLRNDAGGCEEQLVDGVNGHYIDSRDFKNVARAIEEVLSRDKTSNSKLQAMGLASQKRIARYEDNPYCERLEELDRASIAGVHTAAAPRAGSGR